ncbi:MAG: hypothetical protein GX638_05390 [Crenarchaeota archaeon]|nr:hypothetical protein [Thermoproteota archaeon]
MIIVRTILANILSIIVFAVGIVIGIAWVWVLNGPIDPYLIDLPLLLAYKITPALLAVFLSRLVFKKISIKNEFYFTNLIILYVLMLIFFATTISSNLHNGYYSNFIYTLTGIVSVIAFMLHDIKFNNEAPFK